MKSTTQTANASIKIYIAALEKKVKGLSRAKCANEQQKLEDFATSIDFWSDPTLEKGLQYFQYMNTLDQKLLDGHRFFDKLSQYKNN